LEALERDRAHARQIDELRGLILMQQQQNEKLQGLVDSQLKQPVAAPVVEAAPTAVVARVETPPLMILM